MIHLIIINLFNWSGVWIWNWVIVWINWNVWSGNFNTTIIYGMMIKFTHYIWNNRVGSGRRGPGFEVSCRRLSVLFYWRFFWFVTMDWFIFLLRLVGRNFGLWMINTSYFCPILPQHSQIIFCLTRRSEIPGRRVAASLLLEDEGPEWWEQWTEVVNVVGYPIISR